MLAAVNSLKCELNCTLRNAVLVSSETLCCVHWTSVIDFPSMCKIQAFFVWTKLFSSRIVSLTFIECPRTAHFRPSFRFIFGLLIMGYIYVTDLTNLRTIWGYFGFCDLTGNRCENVSFTACLYKGQTWNKISCPSLSSHSFRPSCSPTSFEGNCFRFPV